jgi:hypothetical protein
MAKEANIASDRLCKRLEKSSKGEVIFDIPAIKRAQGVSGPHSVPIKKPLESFPVAENGKKVGCKSWGAKVGGQKNGGAER